MIISNFPFVGNIKNQIETHNLDNSSHPDIRKQLEALSGGGVGEKEIFIIPVLTPQTQGESTTTISSEEIIEALDAGKQIVIAISLESVSGYIYYCYPVIVLNYTELNMPHGYYLYAVSSDYSWVVECEFTMENSGIYVAVQDPYSADFISYDPSTSGLSAKNVQSAIDELAARPSGGTTEPLSLTGFQLDPDNPTGVTMTLQLTDEQWDAVNNCMVNGLPVLVENMYLLYPITDASGTREFASGIDMSGIFYYLRVDYTSHIARFSGASPSTKPIDYGIVSSLDLPFSVSSSNLTSLYYDLNISVSVTYQGESIVLSPDSRLNSTTYVFANSTYRLTFDISANTATLSLIDTVTEAEMTEAISDANNEVLTESKSYTDQKITGGTTDIGVGAPLASGAIYIVYE